LNGDALAGGTAVTDGLMAAVWIAVNGVLAIGSHRAAGWMFPGNPRSVRWLSAVLICISTIAIAAVVLGALGMLYRWPLMVLVGTAGSVMAWQCRDARANDGARPAGKLATVGWTILAGFAVAHVIWRGLTGFPDDFDTLMYHLPIVVEWLQSASLYVPDSSYWWTPGVGEISVLWMVAPFSGDFLYSLGNVPFVVLWALGSYRLSRELRLPPKWAHLAAMSAMLVFTTLDELDDCQNDIAIAALFVCAAAFGGQYLRRPTLGSVVMMGLSVGALAGVKYNALGYAALVVAAVSGACLLERRYHDCMKCVLASCGGFMLLGSYWYVRNAVVSGSPLYPMGLAEDIGTGYPDVSSTTLWGHGNPNVPRLAIAALWRMTGPLHYGAFWGLPIAIALLCLREIVMAHRGVNLAFYRRPGTNRYSTTLRYATALLIGSFVLLLISPFCVEDVPRSMNHLIWAYTPARYGLSFLTMLVVVGAMATQRCYRIVCGWLCTERLRWEFVPLAAVVVLGLAQGWLVIAEHNRERRGGWTFDFCILLLDTILFLALAGLVAQSARGKVKFGLIAASGLLLMVAIGYRSAQWHSGFGEHFDRLFRSDLFSPSDSSSPVWGDRIMVLDMRSYPFYGSSRGVTVYRPRSIGSVDEIVDAMRAGNFRMIATHRERERNYYLYTDTYNWLNDDKNRFTAIPTVGYYSLFLLEPVETEAGAP
jgi:hypothetical protein